MAPELHPEANLLSAWLEGNLSRRSAARVTAHLGACGECRRLAACAGLLVQDNVASSRRAFGAWRPRFALAAATVLVAGAAWSLGRRPTVPDYAPVATSRPILTLTPAPVRVAAPRPRPLVHRAALVSRPAKPVRVIALPPPPDLLPTLDAVPAIHFTSANAGFSDQPAQFGAQQALAAWGGATQSLPVAPPPVIAARLSYAGDEPLDFSQATVDTGLNPWGLGWAGASAANAAPLRIAGIAMHVQAADAGSLWAASRTDQVYTSSDHGVHWRPVVLPGASQSPAAVASISFQNQREGVIRDRTGATWLTHDAGASWVRR